MPQDSMYGLKLVERIDDAQGGDAWNQNGRKRQDRPSDLRRCHGHSRTRQVRRLLAVALILGGGSRSDAAQFAGVTLQVVRDWVLGFKANGPDGLATRMAPRSAYILNDEQRACLAEIVEAGPIPAAYGLVRWRLADLAQWVCDEFSVSVTRPTLGRELRALKACVKTTHAFALVMQSCRRSVT